MDALGWGFAGWVALGAGVCWPGAGFAGGAVDGAGAGGHGSASVCGEALAKAAGGGPVRYFVAELGEAVTAGGRGGVGDASGATCGVSGRQDAGACWWLPA